LNKFIGIGNITKDIEMIDTSTGGKIAKFTVAFQRKFKNKETGKYDADFINIVSFNKTAEFVQKYFNKGNKIAIVGSLQTRTYDAQDGTKRYVTECVVDECEFVERKTESKESKPKEVANTSDLPF